MVSNPGVPTRMSIFHRQPGANLRFLVLLASSINLHYPPRVGWSFIEPT
jgi:hypothetical protein